MRTFLGVLAVAMLATGLFGNPAQARCWWNGYRTVCVHHPYWWYHRPHGWHSSYWRHRRWCYYHPYRCR
jgi:hypothetical protein